MPSGDLIYARILDQEAVIINSQDDAETLLEKRSRIYSDRPYLATVVPCVLPELFYSTSPTQLDLGGRSYSHSWVMALNGVLTDESSTSLSKKNLRSDFAQCRSRVLVR